MICALGDSIGVVIAGRVIQGAGGGVFPLSFGVIRDTFPRERIAGGIGLMSAIFGIGGGIGLPLSGVVVANLDLSWLFWVGLVALPTALAASRVVPPSPVAAWTGVEARTREPLIDLRVLRQRGVALTNLAALLVGFAMFSSFLSIPQFAQAPEATGYGFGMSVTESGLLLVPVAAAQLVGGPVAGWLGTRLGFRSVLAAGGGAIAASFAWLALEHSHPWHFALSGVLLGVGITFALASMANLIVDVVHQSEVGIATAINTVTRTVGGSFGSALAAAVVGVAMLPAAPIAAETAYTVTFALAAGGGLLAVLTALLIPSARAGPVSAADEVSVPA